jgi:hypothetical protein
MDENARLVLQGLRQMTQVELADLDSARAAAQAQARQALDQLPERLKLAARQGLADTDLTPDDFAEVNWPAAFPRLARRVAARTGQAAQQMAASLQRQLFKQLAGRTAMLYSFGVAFDQLSGALLPRPPGSAGPGLLSQLGAEWARYGGAAEPLDAQTEQLVAGTSGRLAARLMPPTLERRLLSADWLPGAPPSNAADLRQAVTAALDRLIDQDLRDHRMELELALDNHVQLVFDELAQTLDQCFAAPRQALDDEATRPGPAGAGSPASP